MFSTYSVLPGQQVCIKYFKRSKDVAASTITFKNEFQINEKEEKEKISVKTAHDVLDKSLELLDRLITLQDKLVN